MTSNADRAELLARALRAALLGDEDTIADVCTEDVKAWSPANSASSRDEVLAVMRRRDDAFSEIELEVVPLDVGGDFACVEWRATMTHGGELTLRDGAVLEPTGQQVTLNGVTIAEFEGHRICSVRQYWDELTVFEQLGLVHADEP